MNRLSFFDIAVPVYGASDLLGLRLSSASVTVLISTVATLEGFHVRLSSKAVKGPLGSPLDSRTDGAGPTISGTPPPTVKTIAIKVPR